MIEQPKNIPLPGGKYRLVEDYQYTWTHVDGVTYRMTIKSGFINDGATVHRLFWTLSGLTPDGLLRAGALIHDCVLKHQGKMPSTIMEKQVNNEWVPCKLQLTKLQADQLFRKILVESENKNWHIVLCYYAVRAYTYVRGYSW